MSSRARCFRADTEKPRFVVHHITTPICSIMHDLDLAWQFCMSRASSREIYSSIVGSR